MCVEKFTGYHRYLLKTYKTSYVELSIYMFTYFQNNIHI